MRRLLLVLALLVSVATGCGDDDDSGGSGSASGSEATASTDGSPASSSSTTSTTAATTTTSFDGAVTPTSAPSTAGGVALLTEVSAVGEASTARVTFAFRSEVPGYDIAYVQPPIRADGSGEPVAVAGDAFLSVRMEPASGVDMSGETFAETYTGPDRFSPGVPGVAEVVRTGDFEANLTWVIGLHGGEAPYRVEVDGSTLSIVLLVGG